VALPPTADCPLPTAHSPIHITLDVAEQSIQQKAIVYDGTGDEHYDATSAIIKSMRGSDPDAAIYWLARMLEAGEDPRFIARRVAILASEDIGNADPRAISVAQACYDIVERIGMPEARITLAQAVVYMATAPKSNRSYVAINEAIDDVRNGRTVPVPKHLKDAHYEGAKRFGHGRGYKYAHDHEGGFVAQDYLGVDKIYYEPTDRGYEVEIAQRLKRWREAAGKVEPPEANVRMIAQTSAVTPDETAGTPGETAETHLSSGESSAPTEGAERTEEPATPVPAAGVSRRRTSSRRPT
jgi:putative ATPase